MSSRERHLERLSDADVDVLVVGGGINGAVAAAALAGHGVSVAMVERNDFASFTSQESSNLVWGGFKYLENYELPLVYKLCKSRNHLMKTYPTRMSELGFLATLDRTSPFPPWLAALGSVGYWMIGMFHTRRPAYFRPQGIEAAEPVVNTATARGGIEYMDAYLKDNDARFVFEFIRSAGELGAITVNYCDLTATERTATGWTATVTDTETGTEHTVRAKAIVNAAGPFVDGLSEQWGLQTDHRIVYSKGIHLVVPRINDSERVLAFFDDTQRLFYVIPMAHRSVIGTTDTRTGDPYSEVTDEDISFVLEQINARLDLEHPITPDDIIGTRSGVRPLVVDNDGDDRENIDWTSLSRKHAMEADADAKVVTIFGGKLTDCLNVGEEVVDAVRSLGLTVGAEERWFGEPDDATRDRFMARAARLGLDRPPRHERGASAAEVIWRQHGMRSFDVLDAIDADASMAEYAFGTGDTLRAELAVFAEHEFVVHLDDFVRRRTKLRLIERDEILASDPGLKEAAKVLFGDRADTELATLLP